MVLQKAQQTAPPEVFCFSLDDYSCRTVVLETTTFEDAMCFAVSKEHIVAVSFGGTAFLWTREGAFLHTSEWRQFEPHWVAFADDVLYFASDKEIRATTLKFETINNWTLPEDMGRIADIHFWQNKLIVTLRNYPLERYVVFSLP
jgi:hypothetical protein